MKVIRTEMFKAASTNIVQALVKKYGPYAYHRVSSRVGPQEDARRVKSVLKEGLIPRPESWHGGFQTPRKGRVYLFLPGSVTYDVANAQIRVDIKQLNPSLVGCDEDIFDPTVSNTWQELGGVAPPPAYSREDWSENMPTLGDWADKHAHIFDHPQNILKHLDGDEGYLSFSYGGVIPPSALSINPEFKG